MINIQFNAREKLLDDIQTEFNKMASEHYPDILEWNHYTLWKRSGQLFNPDDWKQFRLNDKVDRWYNEELILIAKQKAIRLLSTAGDRTSVADSQALNQVVSFLDKHKQEGIQETKIVYCFVPLTQEEEKAENVKIIQNIPSEISNAMSKH